MKLLRCNTANGQHWLGNSDGIQYVLPGNVHDQVFLLLHLMILHDGGQPGKDPLTQTECWLIAFPEG